MTKMEQTIKCGTEFWNDSCDADELRDAVAQGASGATSNPVIVATVVRKSPDLWGRRLDALIAENPRETEDEIALRLLVEVARAGANLLRPAFETSGGRRGRQAIQVNPKLYPDAKRMVAQAKTVADAAANFTVKLPVTPAGLEAMEEVTAAGITVTATVSFSVAQAVASAEAMERGMKRGGHDLRPFVSIMLGRLDDHLKRVMQAQKISVDPGCLEWAGVAVFKRAWQIFRERGYRAVLLGAAYRNHMHWSQLIGGGGIASMPHTWWTRFNASRVEVRESIADPVRPEIVAMLNENFPDFRRAYEPDGMKPGEFTAYGSTVHTLKQFIGGYEDLLGVVRDRMLR